MFAGRRYFWKSDRKLTPEEAARKVLSDNGYCPKHGTELRGLGESRWLALRCMECVDGKEAERRAAVAMAQATLGLPSPDLERFKAAKVADALDSTPARRQRKRKT